MIAAHIAELQPLYPTISSDLFYPPIPEFELLPKSPEPYRVTAGGFTLVPNQSALWELEDRRGYGGNDELTIRRNLPALEREAGNVVQPDR